MYSSDILERKNSFKFRKLINRSKSEIENNKNSNGSHPKQALMKVKRRSLTLKNVHVDAFKNDQIKQAMKKTVDAEETNDQEHNNYSELNFLKSIIRQKQQILETKLVDMKQKPKKVVQQYQYYDMIVRDLISQIRCRNSKDINVQMRKTMQIKISKPQKFNGNRYNRQTFLEGKNSGSPIRTTIKYLPNRQKMVFSLTNGTDTIYQRKITSYIELLYKVNFSNSIYVDLSLSKPKLTYKVKIGPGNNCLLIKSLIKRRFWLEFTNSTNQCHFIWTQNTQKSVHEGQEKIGPNQFKQEKNYQILSKSSKYLVNSEDQFLMKILPKQQIQIANECYEKSNFATGSCYPLTKILKVSNHIPMNCIIGSKKILFMVMFWYYKHYLLIDPFDYLPKTYHFQTGDSNGHNFKSFMVENGAKKQKVWIIKPGQNTNRGNGITVGNLPQISNLISRRQFHKNGELKTFIVQQYLRPFLYNNRKFDIRHYLLITSTNGYIKAYWYKEGYIRTSSEKYDLDDLSNQIIHLTNDAIQKHGSNYGKYEPGNKISYSNFQRYLDNNYPHKKYNFKAQIIEKMKIITTDMIRASFQFIDPHRKGHNFQFYGLDFMVNSKFKPYLIECNANPCLQISCPLLERIIPTAVQHSFRLALDPLFPPPQHYSTVARYQLCDRVLQKLNYELIFDEKTEGPSIRQKTKGCQVNFQLGTNIGLSPDEDLFEDEGEELNTEIMID